MATGSIAQLQCPGANRSRAKERAGSREGEGGAVANLVKPMLPAMGPLRKPPDTPVVSMSSMEQAAKPPLFAATRLPTPAVVQPVPSSVSVALGVTVSLDKML